MKCFYHRSDLDGHCSGAIVKDKYPECEMIGVDYNDTLDRLTISPEERIFIVDFSFSVEEMLFLDDVADIIWIDHHKTAIEKMCVSEYPIDVSTIATQYGGGGHKGAAGFYSDKMVV